MFLTVEHLNELTGYKRPAAMRRWLSQQGMRFLVGPDGYPRLLEKEVERVMVGSSASNISRSKPNAEALENWKRRV
jgi:hypothetical protein